MDDLRSLAFTSIITSIHGMEKPKLIKEAFSPFASRQDLLTNTYTVAQALTCCIDTRKSVTFMSSDSGIFWPTDPMKTFDNSYYVIFLGKLLIAGTFWHPCYKSLWVSDPLLGDLLERATMAPLSKGCLSLGRIGPKMHCLHRWTVVPSKTSASQFPQVQNQLRNRCILQGQWM